MTRDHGMEGVRCEVLLCIMKKGLPRSVLALCCTLTCFFLSFHTHSVLLIQIVWVADTDFIYYHSLQLHLTLCLSIFSCGGQHGSFECTLCPPFMTGSIRSGDLISSAIDPDIA